MLVQLEAHGFRNLESLSLTLGAGVHLLLGDNGTGKTSFLEAIYLLGTSRSFRTAHLGDCCRHGTSSFHLCGEVEAESRTLLELGWDSGKRLRLVNRRRTSLAEHLAALPAICWSSRDTQILVGPPAERRRFLDRGVVGRKPGAIMVLTRYRQAMQEKRRWLQRHQRGGRAELESWNRVLAESAAEIIRLRAAYGASLGEALKTTLETCAAELPEIEIRYRPSPRRGTEGAAAILAELEAVSDRECRIEQPVIGPHRDDMEICWGGDEIRRVASSGERKYLGLILLAAHGQVLEQGGRSPIYLLDDVDTELDQSRLESLWRAFGSARQLVATSNRPRVWEAIDTRRWRCRHGRLSPEAAED